MGYSFYGKKNMVLQYIQGDLNECISRGKNDFVQKYTVLDNSQIQIKVWETHILEKFGPIVWTLYRRKNGIILVYDVWDRKSFQLAKNQLLRDIQEHIDHNCHIIIIGNKSFFQEVREREVSYEEGELFAKSIGSQFFEVNAYTGENVNNAIDSFVEEIYNNRDIQKLQQQEFSIRIPQKKKGKCYT